MDWMPFRKSTRQGGVERPLLPAPDALSAPLRLHDPSAALDVIGRRNEVVRDRISGLAARLEDLKGLQDHFASIVDPLAGVIEELPRATTRIAELEASLGQEQQSAATVRRELSALEDRAAILDNEVVQGRTLLARLEGEQVEKDAAADEIRAQLRDKTIAVENLERRLFSETEKASSAAAEVRALRGEIQVLDQSLARTDHELGLARERIALLGQETQRLEQFAEDQAAKLADLTPRHEELTAVAATDRDRIRLIEAQLDAETTRREKAESHYETVLASSRAERSSLELRLEGTLNRAGATDRLLGQLRDQLREKDEVLRQSERNLKQSVVDRASSERRMEALHVELARQNERLIDFERQKADLGGRCDMLGKALAAKDAGLEQGNARNAALTERIEQLVVRQEADRAELERENRRLLEELQKERSERLMAMGALAIARDSRLALQKQHDSLRRSSRGIAVRSDGAPADVEAESDRTEADTNVRSFTPPSRSG